MYFKDNVEVHELIYMGMKRNVVQMVHLKDHHLNTVPETFYLIFPLEQLVNAEWNLAISYER